MILLAVLNLIALVAILLAVLRGRAPKVQPVAPVVDHEHEYIRLTLACIDRQHAHEAEHHEAHPGKGDFSAALRRESMARRLERKVYAAGLPPLDHAQRIARFKETI